MVFERCSYLRSWVAVVKKMWILSQRHFSSSWQRMVRRDVSLWSCCLWRQNTDSSKVAAHVGTAFHNIRRWEYAQTSFTWFERVPTASNCADEPSRDITDHKEAFGIEADAVSFDETIYERIYFDWFMGEPRTTSSNYEGGSVSAKSRQKRRRGRRWQLLFLGGVGSTYWMFGM